MIRRGAGIGLAVVVLVALALVPASASAAYYANDVSWSLTDGTQGSQSAECDNEDIAIGGGILSGGFYDDNTYLNTSRPSPETNPISDTWLVYADNYTGSSGSVEMSTYVMCDSKGKASDYRIRTDGAVVGDATLQRAVARCQQGETVVGGGGRSSGFYADETYLASSTPWDGPDGDRAPDDGWQAAINDDEAGAVQGSMDVFAICDRRHGSGDFTYPKDTAKVDDADQALASAKCGGKQLVGGGVRSSGGYAHGLYINSTYPLAGDEKWSAWVDNYDTPDDKTKRITATAICRK